MVGAGALCVLGRGCGCQHIETKHTTASLIFPCPPLNAFPGTARTLAAIHSHTATSVGRTKLLVFGGLRGEAASADISVLNTDTMKWVVPQVRAGREGWGRGA